jgi:hypothetical protein
MFPKRFQYSVSSECKFINLIIRNKVPVEKMMVAQLIKKLPFFLEIEDLLRCLQQFVVGPHPEAL